MFDKVIHKKVHEFNPSDNLRFRKRRFLMDDKVVAERTELQYKDTEYGWWSTVDMTEETVNVKDEKELWDLYNLKVKK